MTLGSVTKWAVGCATTIAVAGCGSTYMIRGQGGISCANVVEQVRENAQYRNLYAAWLMGYLTRYNFDREKQLGRGFDDATLINTALQYCGANPLNDFDRAAAHVVKELDKSS